MEAAGVPHSRRRKGWAGGWEGAGQATLPEDSCLGPQLRDKERQMIKERFKVSWPVPALPAAPVVAQPPDVCLRVTSLSTVSVTRASMMALKSCARSRRPGLSPTRSRGTRSAKRRSTSSGRPTRPFCTGEPPGPTPTPAGPLGSSSSKHGGVMGLGGRFQAGCHSGTLSGGPETEVEQGRGGAYP